ncbi:MAG: carboxymuconolactone decarboxylase family protein [Acidimicrobiia bacterium]
MTTRLDRGLEKLAEIDGEAGQRVMTALQDIAPDLARYIAEFAFGDVYSRPELVPRDRQLVTIGVLSALGGCEAQLRVHVGAALNVGLTPREIVEAVIHVVVYAGFPRALNAINVVREVFEERGVGRDDLGWPDAVAR